MKLSIKETAYTGIAILYVALRIVGGVALLIFVAKIYWDTFPWTNNKWANGTLIVGPLLYALSCVLYLEENVFVNALKAAGAIVGGWMVAWVLSSTIM